MRLEVYIVATLMISVTEVHAEEVPIQFRMPKAVARMARPIAPPPVSPLETSTMDEVVEQTVIFEPPVCAEYQVANQLTEYHCCWPGQIWEEEACLGVPVCPSGWAAVDTDCLALPELIPFSAGEVTIGSPGWEPGRSADEVQREVTIDSPYQVSATEVTQELWSRVMGSNPVQDCAELVVSPQRPVVCVSWNDAVSFANALSSLAGLQPAYTVEGGHVVWDRSADGFRLPTEAEWEAAARAEASTMYAGSDYLHLVGWSAPRSEQMIHPVSTLEPNEAGVYDMSGNVAEWVWDAYRRPFFGKMPDDVDRGRERVIKGGSWYDEERWHRVAARAGALPTGVYTTVGIRLVRDRR